MADIRNFTLKFGYGRPAGLTCQGKLAFAEIELAARFGNGCGFDGVSR